MGKALRISDSSVCPVIDRDALRRQDPSYHLLQIDRIVAGFGTAFVPPVFWETGRCLRFWPLFREVSPG